MARGVSALAKLDVRVQMESSELGLRLPFSSLPDACPLRLQQDANRRFHLITSVMPKTAVPISSRRLGTESLWFIPRPKTVIFPGQRNTDQTFLCHVFNLAPVQELVHVTLEEQQQEKDNFSRKMGSNYQMLGRKNQQMLIFTCSQLVLRELCATVIIPFCRWRR